MSTCHWVCFQWRPLSSRNRSVTLGGEGAINAPQQRQRQRQRREEVDEERPSLPAIRHTPLHCSAASQSSGFIIKHGPLPTGTLMAAAAAAAQPGPGSGLGLMEALCREREHGACGNDIQSGPVLSLWLYNCSMCALLGWIFISCLAWSGLRGSEMGNKMPCLLPVIPHIFRRII